MSAVEFSRPERIDLIGAGDRGVTVEADADERRRLAGRFGLVAVDRLTGDLTIRRETAGVRVCGAVQAAVTQACSVTGEPLPARVDEAIDLLFVPTPAVGSDGDEVELGDDSIDVMYFDGGAIDLGEVAAETMALALDPFPRGPGADAALKQAGVLGEGQGGAFGQLAALLKKD